MHGAFCIAGDLVLFILLELIEYVIAMVFVRCLSSDLLGDSAGKMWPRLGVCDGECSVPLNDTYFLVLGYADRVLVGVSLAVRLCAACYHSILVTRRPEAPLCAARNPFVDSWWIRLASYRTQMHKGH